MNPEAMKPYGLALLDYHNGNHSATYTTYRDDDWKTELPVSLFFRQAQDLKLEKIALDLCRGNVLDVGAGTGIHSLFLQDKGLQVCAIDVSSEAVQIMQERGVVDVWQDDVLSFENEQFDTILMMGHGIGVVEDINGLIQFLDHVISLLNLDGQVLLTSLDVQVTDNPMHLRYQEQNLEAGRYFGEIRMQFKYGNSEGPLFGWLHVDPETLGDYALRVNLNCEVIEEQGDGNYLARLTLN
ncbi:class I SAM-dependent methyltransferase [Chloroflexota bacterium]